MDVLGCLLSVVVHAANIHDTKSGISTAKRAYERYSSIQKFCADAGYRGTFVSDLKEQLDLVDMTKYEQYQLQWMISHGYSLQNLIEALTEMQFGDPEDSDRISTPIFELFDEWVADIGFGSEIWVCEAEWRECEGAEDGEQD